MSKKGNRVRAMSISAIYQEAAQNKKTAEGGAGSAVDWEQKYFDSIELHIKDIKDELRQSEDRIHIAIREAMQKVYMQSDQRHREYQNVNNRIDQMMARMDKKQEDLNKWILRTAIAIIIGVAGLVSTGIFGIAKIITIIPGP